MSKKRGSSGTDSDNNHADYLYDWISEGYFVDPLMEAMRSGDQQKIDEAFHKYTGLIDRLAKVKDKMTQLGFNEEHASFSKFSGKLNDPTQVESLESFATELETGPKVRELMGELASLNTKGFEEEANRIRLMFDNREKPEIIEDDIRKLKKKIKEKFFEMSFEETVVPTETVPKPMPATAEIIFLLHKDGSLLSVKSRNPPSDLDKKLMSRMVMAIKEQMGRAFKEGEHVHSLNYEGHTILLEDSVHVYAAVVIKGESKPVMYKVILKALQIMEKKLAAEFDSWTGDRSKLDNLDKYVTAIFQALDKVN